MLYRISLYQLSGNFDFYRPGALFIQQGNQPPGGHFPHILFGDMHSREGWFHNSA